MTSPSPLHQEEPSVAFEVLEGTRRCIDCRQEKLYSEMVPNKRMKDGVYKHCRSCDYKRKRQRREDRAAGKIQPGELRRKLPPYPVLRRLYVDQGMTLSEIAQKYDVARTGVFHTIKRRAERRGEWPLPVGSLMERHRRGSEIRYVRPELILALMEDHVAELTAVAYDQAIAEMLAEGWSEFEAREWLATNNSRASTLREPSLHRLTWMRFCREHRISWAHIQRIKAGRVQRITKREAAKYLRAIGEQIPDHVENWRIPKKYRYYPPGTDGAPTTRAKA